MAARCPPRAIVWASLATANRNSFLISYPRGVHMGELPIKDDIRPEQLAKALSERYLAYALSTITQRALPDVRDGLKPVHRRILWAMRSIGLNPTGAFSKSARVVGDVIGKYHPHGDQSVYDALVRL